MKATMNNWRKLSQKYQIGDLVECKTYNVIGMVLAARIIKYDNVVVYDIDINGIEMSAIAESQLKTTNNLAQLKNKLGCTIRELTDLLSKNGLNRQEVTVAKAVNSNKIGDCWIQAVKRIELKTNQP